jgi:hypothetical protein
MNNEKLKLLAMDLTVGYPRSPRELLGGYVIVARCLDKCRSSLVGENGSYKFWPCSLCKSLITFTGIDRDAFSDFVATGASDEEVGEWVKNQSQVKNPMEIIRWNNKMREMRISELPDELQEHLEADMQSLPMHRPVYVWFDIFDLEEGRL